MQRAWSGAQPVPEQHASTTVLALAVAGRCTCMLAGPSVARECASKCNYARAQTVARNDHARTRALLAGLLAVYVQ